MESNEHLDDFLEPDNIAHNYSSSYIRGGTPTPQRPNESPEDFRRRLARNQQSREYKQMRNRKKKQPEAVAEAGVVAAANTNAAPNPTPQASTSKAQGHALLLEENDLPVSPPRLHFPKFRPSTSAMDEEEEEKSQPAPLWTLLASNAHKNTRGGGVWYCPYTACGFQSGKEDNVILHWKRCHEVVEGEVRNDGVMRPRGSIFPPVPKSQGGGGEGEGWQRREEEFDLFGGEDGGGGDEGFGGGGMAMR